MSNQKKIIIFILSVASIFLVVPLFAETPVEIYYFYLDGCPYCEQTTLFLSQFTQDNLSLKIDAYEISGNKDNEELFLETSSAYGFTPEGVPALFIGDKIIDGFYPELIEREINNCLNSKCVSPGDRLAAYRKTGVEKIVEDERLVNYLKIRWLLIGSFVVFLIAMIFFQSRKNLSNSQK